MRGTILLWVVLALCSGCAWTKDEVDIQYVPPSATPAPVLGARGTSVLVDGVDRRPGDIAQVGAKKNGFGMEAAPILSAKPVASIVQQAVTDELLRRGFRIGSGGPVVTAEVIRFRNNFDMGFFAAQGRADVTISVQVRGSKGGIDYSRTITGEGVETGVQLMGGANTKLALEKALPNAITQLMSDPDFLRALTAANGSRPSS